MAIVAVTGVVDDGDDLIAVGAFEDTLRELRPKGVLWHSWQDPVARILHIEELRPGDPQLPTRTPQGEPWPRDAGGLLAVIQFNLRSPRAAEAYEMVRFYAESGEAAWSIGYQVDPKRTRRRSDGVRVIGRLDLFEVSVVLHGMNRLVTTLEVKTAAVAPEGGAVVPPWPVERDRRVAAARRIAGLPGQVDRAAAWAEERQVRQQWRDLRAVEGKGGVPGVADTPGDVASTERLKRWYTHGEGAAKIRWGQPGDFDRCVRIASKHMPPETAKGYCFTGETEVLTRGGVRTIEALVGEPVEVLTQTSPIGGGEPVNRDGVWAAAEVRSFGVQPVLRVHLRRGRFRRVIGATPEHVWFASEQKRRREVSEVATVDLQPGMRLASLSPTDRAFWPGSGRWWVERVTDDGVQEEVFCAVVPDTGTFTLGGGVWVHNCANRHKEALGVWPGQERKDADVESKRKFTAEQRRDAPTLPGEGDRFPISTAEDVRAAVASFGRAKDEDKPRIKRWIMRRARELDAVGVLPESWRQEGKAAQPAHSGVMVALVVPDELAERLAVKGGEPAADLHVTLAYLGSTADAAPPESGVEVNVPLVPGLVRAERELPADRARDADLGDAGTVLRLVDAVRSAVVGHGVLSGSVGGLGQFPDEGDGAPVWVPVDVPGLSELRQSVMEGLADAGFQPATDHGFTPHITLGYGVRASVVPSAPVRFEEVTVFAGDQRVPVPLDELETKTRTLPTARLAGREVGVAWETRLPVLARVVATRDDVVCPECGASAVASLFATWDEDCLIRTVCLECGCEGTLHGTVEWDPEGRHEPVVTDLAPVDAGQVTYEHTDDEHDEPGEDDEPGEHDEAEEWPPEWPTHLEAKGVYPLI